MSEENVRYVTRNGTPIKLFDVVKNGVVIGGSGDAVGDIPITEQEFLSSQSDPLSQTPITQEEIDAIMADRNIVRWQLMTVLGITESQVDLILTGSKPITNPNE